jgi:membrane-bound hydrogenase subunit mbhJ
VVNRHVKPRVIEVYKATPKPRVVFLIGACACSMTMFKDSYNTTVPADQIFREVDPDAIIAYVPGCPPKPEAMIQGVVKALGVL